MSEPAPARTPPTPKNRVWEIFGEPTKSRLGNRHQAQQPRRKNRPSPTKTASGVCFYGYRFYDPLTGRWLSRDPIQERGGMNLYGFVGNDGVNKLDYLGLECTEGKFKLHKADYVVSGMTSDGASVLGAVGSALGGLASEAARLADWSASLAFVWQYNVIVEYSCCICVDGKKSWVKQAPLTDDEYPFALPEYATQAAGYKVIELVRNASQSCK